MDSILDFESSIILVIFGGIFLFIIIWAFADFAAHRRRLVRIEELNAEQPNIEQVPSYSKGRLLYEQTKQHAAPRPAESHWLTNLIVGVVLVGVIGLVVVGFVNPDGFAQNLEGLFSELESFVSFQLLVREVPREWQEIILPISIMVLFFVPFLLYFIIMGLIFSWRALTWRRVRGVVSQAEITTYMSGSGKNRQRVYRTRLIVAYQAEDGSYHWGMRDIKGWRSASNAMRHYRVGELVTVWHSPSQPQRHMVRTPLRDDETLA